MTLDLDAPFRLPQAFITHRPKLHSFRLFARFDPQKGGLVCESYDEKFALEFQFSPSLDSPYPDLRGCTLRSLQGKASGSNKNNMRSFECAARLNESSSGVINLYSSHGMVRSIRMDWTPMAPNRKAEDDANLSLPGRPYMVTLTHVQARGYVQTAEMFRMRYMGESFNPAGSSRRRRTDTRRPRPSKEKKPVIVQRPKPANVEGYLSTARNLLVRAAESAANMVTSEGSSSTTADGILESSALKKCLRTFLREPESIPSRRIVVDPEPSEPFISLISRSACV